jgi:hypothetical protein
MRGSYKLHFCILIKDTCSNRSATRLMSKMLSGFFPSPNKSTNHTRSLEIHGQKNPHLTQSWEIHKNPSLHLSRELLITRLCYSFSCRLSFLSYKSSLRCYASFQWICITPKPYNDSHWDWIHIKHHPQGVCSHTDLSTDLMALHKKILDIQNGKLPIIPPRENSK